MEHADRGRTIRAEIPLGKRPLRPRPSFVPEAGAKATNSENRYLAPLDDNVEFHQENHDSDDRRVLDISALRRENAVLCRRVEMQEREMLMASFFGAWQSHAHTIFAVRCVESKAKRWIHELLRQRMVEKQQLKKAIVHVSVPQWSFTVVNLFRMRRSF